MNNTMTLAEMANNTNYAAMNYAQLTELNLALLLAVGQIKTLIPIKRREEMEAVTKTYVTVMNGYCATKDEILDCILKEGQLKDKSVFNMDSRDVDDQEESVVTPDEKMANGGTLPALPEATQSGSAESGDVPAQDNNNPDDPQNGKSDLPEKKGQAIIEQAIKDAMARPIKEAIDTNKAYFIDYSYEINENGELARRNSYGHNLDSAAFEEFKSVGEKYMKYFKKEGVIEMTDDYLVFKTSDIIIVRIYHAADENCDGEEHVESSSYNLISDDEEKKMKAKKRAIMKKAIKKAKEDALEGEDANRPYLYKCALQHGKGFLFINRRLPKQYEDAETLVEMKSAVDVYAKHYDSHAEVMSTEDGIAVMRENMVEVIIFNIPNKNNNTETPIMSTLKEDGKKSAKKKSKVKPEKKEEKKEASIKGAKKDPRCIAIVGTKGGETRRWNSFRDCERDLGVSPGTASQVVSGKMKSAKGWKLRKAEDNSRE